MLWRNFGLFYLNNVRLSGFSEAHKCRSLDRNKSWCAYTSIYSRHFSTTPCTFLQFRNASYKTDLVSKENYRRNPTSFRLKVSSSVTLLNRNESCGFSRCQHRLAHQQPQPPSDLKDSPKNDPSHKLPPLPEDGKKKTKAANYVVAKFQKFIDGYQAILEKKFPGAMNVYRVFVVGFKEFSRDFAQYVRIRTKVIITPGRIHNFSRKELELYYRMPSDIFKVGPTLLISALPFANYIVFPIAYYFPKRLLSSHFWSIQQKSQFAIEYQRERYHHYRPVFRQLQKNSELIQDENMHKLCSDVLSKLGSGVHPTLREIMQIKPLFESHPFSLKEIYGPHVKGLCRMYGIHTMYFSRSRLYDHAEMLFDLDVAIVREGISQLKTDELRTICFTRGLNASNTSHRDMLEYLHQWISISTTIEPDTYSLLLHLPVFLGYNNPNNWALKM